MSAILRCVPARRWMLVRAMFVVAPAFEPAGAEIVAHERV